MDQIVTLREPSVEAMPEILLAGLCERVSLADRSGIPALWYRFSSLIGTLSAGIPGIAFGANFPAGGDGFDYMAAISMRSLDGLPPGVASLTVPARRWASFHHAGPPSTIAATCDAIFSGWPAHLGAADTAPVVFLERYGPAFDPLTLSGGVDLLVPLKD